MRFCGNKPDRQEVRDSGMKIARNVLGEIEGPPNRWLGRSQHGEAHGWATGILKTREKVRDACEWPGS